MSKDLILSLNPASAYLDNLEQVLLERKIKPELSITSLPKLNVKIWGIHRRKMTIIAARPSIGKSAMAIQIAYDLAKQGKKVVFLSLEMTCEDIIERIFCSEYKINNMELLRGEFSTYKNEFEKFKLKLKDIPISISDCIGKNWLDIITVLDQLSMLPDVVFIDHINAISVGRNAKGDIDDYIINMYEMAKSRNIALIVCCQINRDNQKDDDKTPQLHELKGSGNLEEMADIVIMLHWPFKYAKKNQLINRGEYFFIVGKNRNGPTGYVECTFKPEHYTFTDKEENNVE